MVVMLRTLKACDNVDKTLALIDIFLCFTGNSDHMRYPDTMRSPNIPHDVYTEEMAAEGLELTQMIVSKVAVMVRGENQKLRTT